MTAVADAYVRFLGDTKDINRTLTTDVPNAADKAGQTAGSRFSGKFGTIYQGGRGRHRRRRVGGGVQHGGTGRGGTGHGHAELRCRGRGHRRGGRRGAASSLQAFISLSFNAVIAGVISPLVSGSGLALSLTAGMGTFVAWLLWYGCMRSHRAMPEPVAAAVAPGPGERL